MLASGEIVHSSDTTLAAVNAVARYRTTLGLWIQPLAPMARAPVPTAASAINRDIDPTGSPITNSSHGTEKTTPQSSHTVSLRIDAEHSLVLVEDGVRHERTQHLR